MASTALTSYEEFSLTIVPNREEVVVALRGEIDLDCAAVIEGEVRELIDRGFDRVVLDLREVSFLDSTGLHTLLSLRERAQRAGGHLVLVPGPGAVQRIFEVTGIADRFDWWEPARR